MSQQGPSLDAVQRAWRDWLDTFLWTHFATFTFGQPRSEASAQRAWNAYLADIRRHIPGVRVGYFCGYEYGTFGRLHLHALMCVHANQSDWVSSASLDTPFVVQSESLWRMWWQRFGRAQVADYDRTRGATGYVSKYVTKALAMYDCDGMIPASQK